MRLAVKEAEEESADNRRDLIWAKGYDAFILLGGFLMLAGALIGSSKDNSGTGSAPPPPFLPGTDA